MKRAGKLWESILDRDNLRMAFLRAVRGKRDRYEARNFAAHLDLELHALAQALREGTIRVGVFNQFVIYDPKERVITAPCFRERVLHHALINVCEPVFERWLIADTFACRRGQGREAALARARRFACRFPCFLTLDIRKYFDSVPHDELLARLSRLIKDSHTLALFGQMVRAFRGEQRQGLPIGSLTSQHLANFYLGWFDRYVKERLKVRGYVRYMDDMALWGHSTGELARLAAECRDFLSTELRLDIKPTVPINRVIHGMDFLGCRIFPTHMTLNRRSRVRFQRRLLVLEQQFREGQITERELRDRATAIVAFARAAGVASWRFRTRVLRSLEARSHQARTA